MATGKILEAVCVLTMVSLSQLCSTCLYCSCFLWRRFPHTWHSWTVSVGIQWKLWEYGVSDSHCWWFDFYFLLIICLSFNSFSWLHRLIFAEDWTRNITSFILKNGDTTLRLWKVLLVLYICSYTVASVNKNTCSCISEWKLSIWPGLLSVSESGFPSCLWAV